VLGRRPLLVVLAASFIVLGGGAHAQTVQVAPFGGVQFGGVSPTDTYSGAFFAYGAALDLAITEELSAEFLYSRQNSSVAGPYDMTVERLMAGFIEERDVAGGRLFGVALAGATRFGPNFSGYGSDTFFTLGLGLGLKHRLSDHFGFRMEARGFYAITSATTGLFCRGGCFLVFSGSGLFQADLSAGLIIAF
jgi:hypothetical protein